jgi:cell division protein FtsX
MQQTKVSPDRLKNLLVVFLVLVVVVVSMGVWRMIQETQNFQNKPVISVQLNRDIQTGKSIQDQSQALDVIRDQVVSQQKLGPLDPIKKQSENLDAMKNKEAKSNQSETTVSINEQSRVLDEARNSYE